MPTNINTAICFLETQWSAINNNKIKGIKAEIRLEEYLKSPEILNSYEYIIPGGWIISPGKNTNIEPPTKGRIAILPIPTSFSWTENLESIPFTAQVLAESYFRQVGIKTYFAKFNIEENQTLEESFTYPTRRSYPTTYNLEFFKIGSNGLESVNFQSLIENFSNRNGLAGMRAYAINRINRNHSPWNNSCTVTKLFWKEYSRYFIHRNYLVSSNDLDFFIIGKSGKAYPVEFKSKTVYEDNSLGDWFGIDVGPYTKLSFFVSLSNNMEALYFIEEVDNTGNTLNWLGIKFSELMKYCHWVSQAGGSGMGGGTSYTIKVPKSVFKSLYMLLTEL